MVNENLISAISHNPDLKTVIFGMDTLWFVTDKDFLGYNEYPDYLYDDNILNDTNYIFNSQILSNDIIPISLFTCFFHRTAYAGGIIFINWEQKFCCAVLIWNNMQLNNS